MLGCSMSHAPVRLTKSTNGCNGIGKNQILRWLGHVKNLYIVFTRRICHWNICIYWWQNNTFIESAALCMPNPYVLYTMPIKQVVLK